jgi:PST family polysaccharide transporter
VQIGPDRIARNVLRALRPQWSLLAPIFGYCVLMVGTISATNLVQTWLRSQVLTLSGSAANGYLQVATALSSYLLSFVMTGFWGHLHARAAAEGDSDEVRAELRKAVRLGVAISFAGCVAAIVLAPLVIALFYAPSFAQATGLLRPYLVGEFAFQAFSMIVAYQLTIGRRRRYAALNAVYIAALAVAGTWLIPQLGAGGYVVAHIAAASLAGLAGLGIALRHRQLTWPHAGMLAGLWAAVGAISWLFGGFSTLA